MPTYVYECSACQDVFEVEQRIIEDALKDCPCGSKGTVKRLIQPTAVMFKGGGFHINDYAAKAAPTKEDHDAPIPAAKETKLPESTVTTPVTLTPEPAAPAKPTAPPAKSD